MKKFVLSLAVLAASGAYVWNQWSAAPDDALIGMTPANVDIETPATSPAMPASKDVLLPAPPAPAAPASIQPAGPFLPSREPVKAPLITAAVASPPEPKLPPSTPAPVPALTAAAPALALPSAPTPDVAASAASSASEMPLPRPRPRPPVRQVQRELNPFIVKASMTVAAGGYADGKFTGPAVDAYYGMVQIQAVVQHGRIVGIKVLQYPSDRRTSVAINRQALPMLRDEVVAAQSASVDIVSGATLTSEAFIRSLRGALQRATA